MNALIFSFLIVCAAASANEVFRVSRVVAAAGEGVEQMTFKIESEKRFLRADCDLIETMAIHFPEVAALRKTAKDGTIELTRFRDAFDPYVTGQKPLPEEVPGQPAPEK